MRSIIYKSLVVSTLALSFAPFAVFAEEAAVPAMPAPATPEVTAPATVSEPAKEVTNAVKKPAANKVNNQKAKKVTQQAAPTAASGTATEATQIVDSNEPTIDTIGD